MSGVRGRTNTIYASHVGQPGGPCICGKHMFERANGGTCTWCGHGEPQQVGELAYARNLASNFGLPTTTGQMDARVVPLRSRRRRNSWTEDECVSAYYAWRANHGKSPTSTDWNQPLSIGPGDKRPSYMTIHKLFGGWKGFLSYIADIPRDQVAELKAA